MSQRVESPTDHLLHGSARHGDLEKLQRALDSGRVHVDCKDCDGTTALMLASANGHTDCVRRLLEEGAEINEQRDTGSHALFFASQAGHLDTVQTLVLEGGAAINLGSTDGGTPLFVACQYGHLNVVKFLVDNGAIVDAEMHDGATPLFIAAQNGHYKAARFLMDQGCAFDHRRVDGASPLWIAAQMGNEAIAQDLLEAGAAVDCVREDGATPLFKVVSLNKRLFQAAHKGHARLAQLLLNHNAQHGIIKNGESALHAAALFGHRAVVETLLNADANPLLQNKTGETPIDLAQQMGYDEIVAALQKHSVKFNGTPAKKNKK